MINKFMDYRKIYHNLISRAQNRPLSGYLEQHHIVPDFFFINRRRKGKPGWLPGNPDDPSNLVMLTGREHFIAHLLLTRMYPNEYRLFGAVKMMTMQVNEHRSKNRMYEWVKVQQAIFCSKINSGRRASQKTRKKLSDTHKGHEVTPETRLKISNSTSGSNNHMFGKTHSAETKKKISESSLGHTKSEETRARMSMARSGIPLSEQHRKAISETIKNQPLLECPHCSAVSRSISNMKRWHFDNCKLFKLNPIDSNSGD